MFLITFSLLASVQLLPMSGRPSWASCFALPCLIDALWWGEKPPFRGDMAGLLLSTPPKDTGEGGGLRGQEQKENGTQEAIQAQLPKMLQRNAPGTWERWTQKTNQAAEAKNGIRWFREGLRVRFPTCYSHTPASSAQTSLPAPSQEHTEHPASTHGAWAELACAPWCWGPLKS